MNAERYEEVCREFKVALGLAGEAREAHLNELAERDAELRIEVEEMLGYDSTTADAFDDSRISKGHDAFNRMISEAGSQSLAQPDLDSVGPYRVIEVLGQGGMGTVYLCEQTEPIKRRVAVKLIKLGMDSQRILQRFAIEREALELMEHPGIARLLDAGVSSEGRPYFAMEYIEGSSIIDYCDEHQFSVRERIALLAQALRALHHAHQRGVLHRDLKPSNILVTELDGAHSPKIIDFGLARAISSDSDSSFATRTGEILGTPAYMCPEQLEAKIGDVDVRSDVYSMGALLYELLSGRQAFEIAGGRPATDLLLLRARAETQTPAPSSRVGRADEESRELAQRRRSDPRQLQRLLKGEIDWIVLRAMEYERDRRYGSAAEFAGDLEAFLSNRPLVAGPPEFGYRMSKFVRRHRVAVLASFLVSVSMIGGTVASVLSAKDARAAEQDARAAEQVALEAEEDMAELLEDSRAQNDILYKMLTRPDPRFGGRDTKVVDLMDYAVDYARETYADRPSVLTRVLGSLGGNYRELGMYEEAEVLLRDALEYQLESDPEDHSQVAFKMNGLALLLKRLGKLDEAEALYRSAIAEHEKIEGPVNVSSRPSWEYNLGKLLLERGEIEQAREMFERSLASHRREAPENRIGPALIQISLGAIAQERNEFEAAEAAFSEALSVLRGTDEVPLAAVHAAELRLGTCLSQSGKRAEAEELLLAVMDDVRDSMGSDNPILWIYLIGVCDHYFRGEEFERAEEFIMDAARLAKAQLESNGLPYAQIRHVYGKWLIGMGRELEAVPALEEALAVYELQLPEDDSRLLEVLEVLDGIGNE